MTRYNPAARPAELPLHKRAFRDDKKWVGVLAGQGFGLSGPPSPGVPPKILRPSGNVTLRASASFDPSRAG